MTKTRKLQIKADCDDLWSFLVKAGGKCEHCNSNSRLNAHHYWSRSCLSTRFDLDNGFCLCVSCHVLSSGFSAHKTPAEFVDWAREYRGQAWEDELRSKKNQILKLTEQDYEDLRASLIHLALQQSQTNPLIVRLIQRVEKELAMT